ncbi:MAG: hypothetical protein NC222_06940 [Staphylococcus sp.]|nr:hypothetical protein [Staphylococcus sp.]
MVVQIDMDMPTCHTQCRFNKDFCPKTCEILCVIDDKYHTFKAYDVRCDNFPLMEVK